MVRWCTGPTAWATDRCTTCAPRFRAARPTPSMPRHANGTVNLTIMGTFQRAAQGIAQHGIQYVEAVHRGRGQRQNGVFATHGGKAVVVVERPRGGLYVETAVGAYPRVGGFAGSIEQAASRLTRQAHLFGAGLLHGPRAMLVAFLEQLSESQLGLTTRLEVVDHALRQSAGRRRYKFQERLDGAPSLTCMPRLVRLAGQGNFRCPRPQPAQRGNG